MTGLKRIAVFLMAALMTIAVTNDSFAKKRTSKDVKLEKQKTEKQIAQTKKQIAENDRETGRQLDRLASIKANIALRNDTIDIIRLQIDSVNSAITAMNDSIEQLEIREKSLKGNYERTLRTIRSRRQGMSDLSFIFSSKSFGQAWRRLRYLREIAKTSVRQGRQLAAAKENIANARKSLEQLRNSQALALRQQTAIQTTLKTEQTSADNIIKNLKKQGKSLQRELERRNRQAKNLAIELDKIVEQEIREAEERRRKEAAEKERKRREAEAKRKEEEERRKSIATATPEKQDSTAQPAKKKNEQPAFVSETENDRRLSGSFLSNKGRLLFPVAGKYTIISNFGTNELPELSKVKVDNLGIDIAVPQGTNARAVFEGVVSSIFRLDGYNNIVIVRHGEYLSVYAGIDGLAVKKGDKVKAGQTLGSIYTAPGDDHSRLHFEIRHEKQKLNPVEWVR